MKKELVHKETGEIVDSKKLLSMIDDAKLTEFNELRGGRIRSFIQVEFLVIWAFKTVEHIKVILMTDKNISCFLRDCRDLLYLAFAASMRMEFHQT